MNDTQYNLAQQLSEVWSVSFDFAVSYLESAGWDYDKARSQIASDRDFAASFPTSFAA